MSFSKYVTWLVFALILVLCGGGLHAQDRGMPLLEQKKTYDCGPTAAASCIKWYEQNGYPNIKTRSGSAAIADIKSQLMADAETDKDRTTWTHKLAAAINRFIDEGPNNEDGAYKGRLRAEYPSSPDAYKGFYHIDDSFSEGKNIVLLFKYGKNSQHYVVVENWSGTGATRTLKFMNPASGQYEVLTVTDSGDNLTLTYDGKAGRIGGILTVGPAHTTYSKKEKVDPDDPAKGTKITYTSHFPDNDKMKDLHIWVNDDNVENYSFPNLPEGWQYELRRLSTGKCFLSIYKGSSTVDLVNGADIEVIYKGSKSVDDAGGNYVIFQTTSGTKYPTLGLASLEKGITVMRNSSAPPERPERLACSVMPSPPGEFSVCLSWSPSPDPTVFEYVIRDELRCDSLGATSSTGITLEGLDADINYVLTVRANNADTLLSEASEHIAIDRGEAGAAEIVPGGQQVICLSIPRLSWQEPVGWEVTIPGATTGGALVVTVVHGEPDPRIHDAPGGMHEPWYQMSTSAELVPGAIDIKVPYSEGRVEGSESMLRLYGLEGGVWTDVTTGIDPDSNVVYGTLQELSAFAVVNGQWEIPADEHFIKSPGRRAYGCGYDQWLEGRQSFDLGYYNFGTMDWQGWETGNTCMLGSFDGLATGLADHYTCDDNLTTQVTFFNGSEFPSTEYPGLFDIPYADQDGNAINNSVVSPPIDLNPGGAVPSTASSIVLQYDVYQDLPLDNLVFHYWAVRTIRNGVPGRWKYSEAIYYGENKEYMPVEESIGHLVEQDADTIQVSVGVIDMYGNWCGILGQGAAHTPSPWFDDVTVRRVSTTGPAWGVHDIHLFQDCFSEDGTTSGTCRIDMARDIMPYSNPSILPGDSAVVSVGEFNVGLASHPAGGPAVYIHVKDIPGKSGASISGNPARWPFVSQAGGWTVLRCDSVYASGDVLQGRFCVDLSDSLYVPGDAVQYYFSAKDALGAVTFWSRDAGTTYAESIVRELPCEMACLPTGGSDILYVNMCGGMEEPEYFESAFEALGIVPDRYDVLGPTSMTGNCLASRAEAGQILGTYKTIIWSSGELKGGALGHRAKPGAADDALLLHEFLDESTQDAGLYLSGDGIASEIHGMFPLPLQAYIDFDVIDGSYYELTGGWMAGGVTSPYISGTGIFAGDAFYLDGGCPGVVAFDVIGISGTSDYAMQYPDYCSEPYYASIMQETAANAEGFAVKVFIDGFGFGSVRDDGLNDIPSRVQHLYSILSWFGNAVSVPTGDDPITVPPVTRLFQNYPNPFNPSTVIAFSLARKADVKLSVYNAAGQLVKTLLDERLQKGQLYRVNWDGRNNSGHLVSSGVYFYRLQAGDFRETKKMVVIR